MTHDDHTLSVIRAALEAAAKRCECEAETMALNALFVDGVEALRMEAEVIRSIDPATIEVPSPWVSVSEGLPDEGVTVILFQPKVLEINAILGHPYIVSNAWYVRCGAAERADCTHWTPLPPAPKEGEE